MDTKLLEVLVCPACKSKLQYSATAQTLTCKPCSLIYPIENGIPLMLADRALPLPPEAAQP